VEVQAIEGDLVEDGANVGTEALADLLDVALRRDADVDGVAALRQKTGRGKPVFIFRPINGLLQPVEDLLPQIHGAAGRSNYLKIHNFSTTVENPAVDWGRDTSTRKSEVRRQKAEVISALCLLPSNRNFAYAGSVWRRV